MLGDNMKNETVVFGNMLVDKNIINKGFYPIENIKKIDRVLIKAMQQICKPYDIEPKRNNNPYRVDPKTISMLAKSLNHKTKFDQIDNSEYIKTQSEIQFIFNKWVLS